MPSASTSVIFPLQIAFAHYHLANLVEQIAAVLKQAELGVSVAEVIGQARTMKQHPEENSRLKQMVADVRLDETMLQDVLRSKPLRLPGAVGWSVICATIIEQAGLIHHLCH
jgi:putative transposase